MPIYATNTPKICFRESYDAEGITIFSTMGKNQEATPFIMTMSLRYTVASNLSMHYIDPTSRH